MRRIYTYAVISCLLPICCTLYNPTAAQSSEQTVFAQRRHQLMSQMEEGGVAVFKSAPVSNRNSDVDYEYRQDSDFFYLTGFEEPESAFLLIPGAEKEFILFVRRRNPAVEMWTGKRHGVEGAMHLFGADTAFVSENFEEMLPFFLLGKSNVYYSMNDEAFNNELLAAMNRMRGSQPGHLIDPRPIVHEMRLKKSPYEIDLMRRSIEITCDAHIEAMKAAEPGMYEFELEAVIEYVFRKNGSQRPGFPSIVGSGPNSTILHYESNDRQTRNGDLIVMDIGAEYGYYSADVTRTIPVNGRFSTEQKEIYEIVLAAQQAGIDMIAPGVGVQEVRQKIAGVLKDGLYRLGLITDRERAWQYRVWYPHGPVHWLGLDVHDVGGYGGTNEKRGRLFEPGMVTTVEPGIYVGEQTLDNLLERRRQFGAEVTEEEMVAFIENVRTVAERYVNIGVRIEDDVLVTEDGYELLSAKAPKEIEDIEALMRKTSFANE